MWPHKMSIDIFRGLLRQRKFPKFPVVENPMPITKEASAPALIKDEHTETVVFSPLDKQYT